MTFKKGCALCGHAEYLHDPGCRSCQAQSFECSFYPPGSIGALLVCVRTETGRGGAEITVWASAEEALDAECELCNPCGPRCEGAHLVVWNDGRNQVRSRPPPVPPLEVELTLLYPRSPWTAAAEDLPAPPELNEDLTAEPVGSALAERVSNGQRITLQRQLADAAAATP